MTRRRTTQLVALLLLLLAAVAVPAAQPGGSGVAAATAAASAGADFDNDGFADLAVGVPGENGFAGAVNVLYGSGAGITGTGAQVFTGVGTGPIVGVVRVGGGRRRLQQRRVRRPGRRGPLPVRWRRRRGRLGRGPHGSSDGLTTARGQLFTQVGGAVEGFDLFGFAWPPATSTTTGSAT